MKKGCCPMPQEEQEEALALVGPIARRWHKTNSALGREALCDLQLFQTLINRSIIGEL